MNTENNIEIDNGGPAFPCSMTSCKVSERVRDDLFSYSGAFPGMTLRDHFAGIALQGWLSSYGPDVTHPASQECETSLAELSYKMADAMLKARNK